MRHSHFFILTLSLCASVLAEEHKPLVALQRLSLPRGPGSIEGLGESFSPVLSSGSASYSVKLELPQAAGGHQPELALSYNSNMGMGPFGLGWGLFVDSIQRQTDKGIPTYTSSDTFICGGEELVELENGAFFGENATDYSRFTQDGNGWIRTLTSGVQLRYGTTLESRESKPKSNDFAGTFRWLLTGQIDLSGNRIDYAYRTIEGSPGRQYLSRIRYGYQKGNAPNFHEISFQYEPAISSSTSFAAQFNQTLAHRCSRIEVNTVVQNKVRCVRKYHFQYHDDAVSQLLKITQTNTNDVPLPPLQFEYLKPLTDGEDTSALRIVEAGLPPLLQNRDIAVCDLNHDSLPDICYSVPGQSWRFLLNEGAGFSNSQLLQDIPQNLALRDSKTQLVDVTGDGRIDVVTTVPNNEGDQRVAFYEIATNARNRLASGFASPLPIAKQSFDNTCTVDLTTQGVRLFDVDFNKCVDFTSLVSDSFLIAKNVPGKRGRKWIQTSVPYAESFFPGDTLSPTMRLADLNGDRLMDVVDLFAADGIVKVTAYFGKGDGRFSVPQRMVFGRLAGSQTGEYPTSNLSSFHLSDIDADGLSDLVLVTPGNVRIWPSRSTYFLDPVDVDGPVYRSNTQVMLIDMNANGSTDIAYLDPADQRGEQLKYLDCFVPGRGRLLSRITNGIGKQVDIQYRPIRDYYLAAVSNAATWTTTSPLPMHVVSGVERTGSIDFNGDGMIDVEKSSFIYANPYYDGREKQFRGFKHVTRVDWGDDLAQSDSGTPTKVTRFCFHAGAPDGEDNDGNSKIDAEDFNSVAGSEEEPLKGKLLWEEVLGHAGFTFNQERTLATLADTGAEDLGSDDFVYRRTVNRWAVRRLHTADHAPLEYPNRTHDPNRLVRDAQLQETLVQHIEGPNVATLAVDERKRFAPRILRSTYAHNEFGGLTSSTEFGVIAPASVKDSARKRTVQYAHKGKAFERWILDRVGLKTTLDSNDRAVAATRFLYGDNSGSSNVLPLFEVGPRALKVRTEAFLIPNSQSGVAKHKLFANAAPWIQRNVSLYDDRGNVTTIADGEGDVNSPQNSGHARKFRYDTSFQTYPTEETVFLGQGKTLTASASFDLGFGAITSLVDFAQDVNSTVQDSVTGSDVGVVRNVKGHKTSLGYDSHGRLTSLVKPGDSAQFPTEQYVYIPADPATRKQFVYDAAGGLTLADITNDKWSINLGAANGTLSMVAGLSAVLTQKREAAGNAGTVASATLTDGLGRKVALINELAGDKSVLKNVAITDARGNVQQQVQPYSDSVWTPNTTERRQRILRDPLGRIVSTKHPKDKNGEVAFTQLLYLPLIERTYDEEDTKKNGRHHGTFTDLRKDGFDRLTEVTENVRLSDEGKPQLDLASWVTRYDYDLQDNLVKITDAQKNVTHHLYDSLNRRRKIHDPDRGTWSFEYDLADNLKLQKDARGATIAYTYDGANRKLTETGQLGNITETLTFNYDAPNPQLKSNDVNVPPQRNLMGRLAWVEDLAGEEHVSYTDRGLREWTLRRIATSQGTVTDYVKSETFDAADRPASQALASKNQKHSTGFTYQRRGLFADAAVDSKTVVSLSYHPNDTIRGISHSNGMTTTYSLDNRLRLERLTTLKDGTAFLDNSYTYDEASNLLRIDDKRTAAARASFGDPNRNTQVFQYDNAYRLSSAKYIPGDDAAQPSLTVEYELDRIGNRLQRRHKGQAPIDPDWQKGAGKQSFVATSNQDGKNVPKPPHAPLNADGGASLVYDKSGGVSEYLGKAIVRDPWGRVAEVRVGSKPVASYTYDHTGTRTVKRTETDIVQYPFREVRDSRKSGVTNYMFAGSRRLVSFRTGTATHHQHDHIGSVILSSSVTGQPIEQKAYLPFGAARVNWLKDGHRASPYLFAGKELDAETGLLYFEARYLSPVAGVFVSCDPVNFEADHSHISRPIALNPFLYSLASPSVVVDPTGENPFIIRGQQGLIWLSRTPAGRFVGRHADKAAQWMGRQSQTAVSYLWQHANRILNRPVIGRKLNYLFGKASGTRDNIGKSVDMLRNMQRIGLPDTPANRKLVTSHLQNVFKDVSAIAGQSSKGRTIRESVLSGPRGVVKMKSWWNANKLESIKILGTGARHSHKVPK